MQKRNRILIVETDINNAITGFRSGLVKSLLENRYEVFVAGSLAYSSNFSNEVKEHPSELKVYNIGKLGSNPFYYINYLYRLLVLIIKLKPSICLTFNIRPVFLFGLLNIIFRKPSVATITGTSTYLGENRMHPLFYFFFRLAFSSYEIFMFQNKFDKKIISKFLLNRIKVHIVNGSGVDTELFSVEKNEYKSDFNSKSDFIFVGRLIRQKGILEYISAAEIMKQKYPELTFGILGPFYKNSKSNNAISHDEISQSECHGHIKYFGYTNDVKKFLLSSKCVVLPTYGEGMSNILLEASSLKIPILASNVPGCQEIVNHGETGFLFEPRSVRSLVDTMERFLSLTEDEKELMGARGRTKMIAEFDKNIIIKSYMKAIMSL